MNRFKFRVWDDSVLRYINWEGIGKNHNLWDILDWDRNHYTPEQYTGLKDKNGIGGYENDIFLIYRTNEYGICYGHPMKCVLKYHDGRGGMWSAGWVLDRMDGKYESCNLDDSGKMWYAEKLGNIHENPELLND